MLNTLLMSLKIDKTYSLNAHIYNLRKLPILKDLITEDIYKILKEEQITALMVTHDISEALSMSDRVIVLSQRPATVKNIYDIDFGIKNRSPLACRENPKFSEYFNTMWKELEKYDKAAEKQNKK